MKIKKYNEFVDNDIYIDIENLIKNIEKDYPNVSELYFIHNHPLYDKIIKNGKDSISYLIEKLDDNSCMYWINALEKITNKEFVGKFDELKEQWKNWYKNEFRN